MRMWEPSLEMPSSPISVAFVGHRVAFGRLGDDVGFPGGEVAVVDRDFAFAAVGLELGFGAEDEVGAVGGEGLGDIADRFGGRRTERAGHTLAERSARKAEGDPGGAVGEARRADFGSTEGKGVKAGIGFEQTRGERRRGGCAVRRDADVFGAPATGAARGDVGVDPAVGRITDPGDGTVMDAVEDAARGPWVACERSLPGDDVGLDVIAGGVRRGDELVGAAVEELGGAGLLADVGVGAGIVDLSGERQRGERSDRESSTKRIFGLNAVVIGLVELQTREVRADSAKLLSHAYIWLGSGNAYRIRPLTEFVFFGIHVFEVIGGRRAVGIDTAFEHGHVGVHAAHRLVDGWSAGRRGEVAIFAVAGASDITGDDAIVIGRVGRKIFQVRGESFLGRVGATYFVGGLVAIGPGAAPFEVVVRIAFAIADKGGIQCRRGLGDIDRFFRVEANHDSRGIGLIAAVLDPPSCIFDHNAIMIGRVGGEGTEFGTDSGRRRKGGAGARDRHRPFAVGIRRRRVVMGGFDVFEPAVVDVARTVGVNFGVDNSRGGGRRGEWMIGDLGDSAARGVNINDAFGPARMAPAGDVEVAVQADCRIAAFEREAIFEATGIFSDLTQIIPRGVELVHRFVSVCNQDFPAAGVDGDRPRGEARQRAGGGEGADEGTGRVELVDHVEAVVDDIDFALRTDRHRTDGAERSAGGPGQSVAFDVAGFGRKSTGLRPAS